MDWNTGSYQGNEAPEWATFDNSSGDLKLSEDSTGDGSTSEFGIDWKFGSYSFITPVSIPISGVWKVENWKQWKLNDTSTCEVWDSGFVILSKGKGCASDNVKAAVVASQATVAFAFISSLSSPQGSWSMVNQFQIMMLMPLTGAFFPSDVILFLTGMDFSYINLGFIPIPEIPGIDEFCNLFDYEQKDKYLYGKVTFIISI